MSPPLMASAARFLPGFRTVETESTTETYRRVLAYVLTVARMGEIGLALLLSQAEGGVWARLILACRDAVALEPVGLLKYVV